MRSWTLSSLACASVLATTLVACSGADEASNTGSAGSNPAPSVAPAGQQPATLSSGNLTATINRRMQAGVDAELILPASAEASCTLHGPTNEESSVLHLFADEDGNVHFHAKPTAGVYGMSHTLMDCTARDGTKTTTAVDMESVRDAVVVDNADRFAGATPHVVRPALTDKEYDLPAAELVARGFPPAPDRNEMPAAFESWKAAASKPMLRIPDTHELDVGSPHTLPQAMQEGVAMGVKGTTGSSNVQATPEGGHFSKNWSGFVLFDAPAYSFVAGGWTVPSLTDGLPARSCTWVGLDGWNVNDLIQTGTEQDTAIQTISCNGFCSGGIVVYTYYAWYEYFPANQVRIFDVAPGHNISAYVYAGDTNGNITTNGPYMWFNITDVTSGTTQQKKVTKPSSAPAFSAQTAEWIVERTSVNGKPQWLADYVSQTFTSGFAFDPTDSSFHTIDSDWGLGVTMHGDNGTTVLAIPFENSTSAFGSLWRASH